jgi:protocatechuate 3,4-dioxygenase beta subunit
MAPMNNTALATFVLVALALSHQHAFSQELAENQKSTPAPAPEESEVAKKLIDPATAALRSGASTSDILTDATFLPVHEWPRFRKSIRENARSSTLAITQPREPGDSLVVSGRVLDKGGQPVKKALVYVYQTSAKGWYSDRAAHIGAVEGDRKHARLFGYLVTDDDGKFELRTIRPAGYPNSDLPAHVHIEVERPDGKSALLLTEIQFDDDPRLTKEWRDRSRKEGFLIAPVEIRSDRSQRVGAELRFGTE